MATAAQVVLGTAKRRLIKSASALDFSQLLQTRTRGPGRLYKYRDETVYLDSASEAPLAGKDAAAMSATFTISTPRPDREEDVIVPEGVIFDDYRLNPVVFWDHGFTNLTLPIGTSAAPDGSLAINVRPGESIEATCYFSQSLLEAEQIFHLVDEGVIRAASIHVDPLDAVVRASGPERPGLLVNKSNMIEWSICGVGCNPDAVKKALVDGRLCGKPIHEGLAKSLSLQAAPSQVWSNGKSFTKHDQETDMAKNLRKDAADGDPTPEEEAKRLAREKRRKELDAEDREKRKKAYDDDEEVKRLRKDLSDTDGQDDEPTKSKRKSAIGRLKSLAKDMGLSEDDANIPQEPGEPTRKTDDDDPDRDEGDGDGDRPLGSQVLAALHAALSDVADNLGRTTKPLENPEVKSFCAKSADALQGMMGEAADLHKAEYPDHPELEKEQASADTDNPNNEPQEASGMVKFLARNNTNRLGVKGAGSRLDKLCNRKDVPKCVKRELQAIAKSLARISDEAIAKSKTIAADDSAQEWAQIRKEFAEAKAFIKQAIEAATPANRR